MKNELLNLINETFNQINLDQLRANSLSNIKIHKYHKIFNPYKIDQIIALDLYLLSLNYNATLILKKYEKDPYKLFKWIIELELYNKPYFNKFLNTFYIFKLSYHQLIILLNLDFISKDTKIKYILNNKNLLLKEDKKKLYILPNDKKNELSQHYITQFIIENNLFFAIFNTLKINTNKKAINPVDLFLCRFCIEKANSYSNFNINKLLLIKNDLTNNKNSIFYPKERDKLLLFFNINVEADFLKRFNEKFIKIDSAQIILDIIED